jgi:hypothetical protein
MKRYLHRSALIACLLSALFPALVRGELTLAPETASAAVFCGTNRPVSIMLSNAGAESVKTRLGWRLLQVAGTVVAPVGAGEDSALEVLPGQKVLRTIPVTVPECRGLTRFLVQWKSGAQQAIGTSELLAIPADYLKGLAGVASQKPIGVWDPQNRLKPMLTRLGVQTFDVEREGYGSWEGALAIFGPFASREQASGKAAEAMGALAKAGRAVLWIDPPSKGLRLEPASRCVRQGQGTVVMVLDDLVRSIDENALSQINLLRLTEQAVNPKKFEQLPGNP